MRKFIILAFTTIAAQYVPDPSVTCAQQKAGHQQYCCGKNDTTVLPTVLKRPPNGISFGMWAELIDTNANELVRGNWSQVDQNRYAAWLSYVPGRPAAYFDAINHPPHYLGNVDIDLSCDYGTCMNESTHPTIWNHYNGLWDEYPFVGFGTKEFKYENGYFADPPEVLMGTVEDEVNNKPLSKMAVRSTLSLSRAGIITDEIFEGEHFRTSHNQALTNLVLGSANAFVGEGAASPTSADSRSMKDEATCLSTITVHFEVTDDISYNTLRNDIKNDAVNGKLKILVDDKLSNMYFTKRTVMSDNTDSRLLLLCFGAMYDRATWWSGKSSKFSESTTVKWATSLNGYSNL